MYLSLNLLAKEGILCIPSLDHPTVVPSIGAFLCWLFFSFFLPKPLSLKLVESLFIYVFNLLTCFQTVLT